MVPGESEGGGFEALPELQRQVGALEAQLRMMFQLYQPLAGYQLRWQPTMGHVDPSLEPGAHVEEWQPAGKRPQRKALHQLLALHYHRVKCSATAEQSATSDLVERVEVSSSKGTAERQAMRSKVLISSPWFFDDCM